MIEPVIYMDGSFADEAFAILREEGALAALRYLQQWHCPGEHETRPDSGASSADYTFRHEGYLMAWNPGLGYIGLEYDQQWQERARYRAWLETLPLRVQGRLLDIANDSADVAADWLEDNGGERSWIGFALEG